MLTTSPPPSDQSRCLRRWKPGVFTEDTKTSVEGSCLEKLVLKSHVGLRLQANAGTEDVGDSRALLSQSVDNRSSGRGQRGLKNVS